MFAWEKSLVKNVPMHFEINVAICNNMHFVTKSTHFVITVASCNKTVAFYNKKPDTFCNKLLSQFVIKYHNEPNMKSKPLLILKIRFPCV